MRVESIAKNYGSKVAIRNVGMEFKPGECVSILGPNGAGKSTLFYIIIGLIQPSSGSVLIDGIDITRIPIYVRSKLGVRYLPQESSIFKDLTVEQNITAVLEFLYKDKKAIAEKTAYLLDKFAISHLAKQRSTSLSGGERRRLEIARCLCSNPKFVFMDEPFAGVDPVSVEDISKIIRTLCNEGIGVIFTDHNVSAAFSLSDRSYIIYDGKILVSGTKDAIMSNQIARDKYLGSLFTNQYNGN